jgi:hypothetical protein
VVRTDAGINSVADMKGKRVSTGSAKSGTEVIAQRVLTAAGLNPDTDIAAAAARPHQDRRRHEVRHDRRDVLLRRPARRPGITDLFTTAGGR